MFKIADGFFGIIPNLYQVSAGVLVRDLSNEKLTSRNP